MDCVIMLCISHINDGMCCLLDIVDVMRCLLKILDIDYFTDATQLILIINAFLYRPQQRYVTHTAASRTSRPH